MAHLEYRLVVTHGPGEFGPADAASGRAARDSGGKNKLHPQAGIAFPELGP